MEVTNISPAITSLSHMSATKTKLKLALADLTPHYFLAIILEFEKLSFSWDLMTAGPEPPSQIADP